MPSDTPPPHDDEDDVLSDDIPIGFDDIVIIEDSDMDGFMEEFGVDVVDDAKVTFEGHSGPVFCCAFDKTGQIAVSGGQDDRAFVWNVRTGATVFECKGYKDSVTSSAFNFNSQLVAAGDMSGCLKVYNCSAFGDPTWEYHIDEDLRFLEWHQERNSLFAGTADGNCWLWDLLEDGKEEGATKFFQSHDGYPCICGRILPDGMKSVVGYENGAVRIWDLSATLLHSVQGNSAHSAAVTVIDCHPNSNLIVTGSIDGTAKLIKSSDGKVLYTLRCEPDDIEPKSVEGVGFFSSQQLLATGTVCGSLAIWDIPTQVRRLQYEQESGITQLFCDPTRPMVYTSGTDGVIRLFDGRTGHEEKCWTGHTSAVLNFTLSSCGTMILSSSDDCTCKVFDTR